MSEEHIDYVGARQALEFIAEGWIPNRSGGAAIQSVEKVVEYARRVVGRDRITTELDHTPPGRGQR